MKGNTVDEGIMAMEKLILKIKPGTSTPIKSALVALYTADHQGELRFSKLVGLMQLDIDRHYKTHLLRFYCMETLTMTFQIELYYGFYENYKMVSGTFYTFEYPRGIIGILYRNKDDADIMKIKLKSASPPMKQYEEIKKKRIEEIKQKKKENSFFGKIKGFFSDQEKPVEHESIVYEVKKEKSISFDLSTGTFNTDKIPPEWQELFDSLNLKEEDLKDKEVVNIIVEQTIMQQIKQQAETNPNKELHDKIKAAEEEEKQYYESLRKSKINNLPPPPPPPQLLTPPTNPTQRASNTGSKRGNLMDQIRNNNVKLKHVETSQKGINLDLTNMNKEERMDHAERLRMKLQMRKKALNRREASDDQSD